MEELLKKLGYADEQVKAILDGMAESKIYTASEEKLDDRYAKLKGDHERLKGEHGSAAQQLADANATIGELKKANESNADLQAKIADYEKRATDAEAKAAKVELEAAVKVELLANGAVADDIDYLMYRIGQGDGKPEMKDGKLSGFDDVVKELKTKCPSQFESTKKGEEGGLKLLTKELGGGEPGKGCTKEEILKKPYAERMRLYEDDPEAFNEIMKG